LQTVLPLPGWEYGSQTNLCSRRDDGNIIPQRHLPAPETGEGSEVVKIETRAQALHRLARAASELAERMQQTVARRQETVAALETQLAMARHSLQEAETMLVKMTKTSQIAHEAAPLQPRSYSSQTPEPEQGCDVPALPDQEGL
jgi:hypothetical protein